MNRGRGRARYRIRGMDCADEVAALKKALREVVDPEQLRFDLIEGTMEAPASVSSDAVVTRVGRTGMRAEPISENEGDGTGAPDRGTRIAHVVPTVCSGVFLVLGFVMHLGEAGLAGAIGSGAARSDAVPTAAMMAYAIAVVGGLAMVGPKVWYSVRAARLDMNVLMTLAVAGAIGLGEWFEAATVSFLFALSLTLEAWSIGRARRAVEALLSLAPLTVRVRTGSATEDVDPEGVPVGTVFEVRPGERIALDGSVVAGSTDVDQAPITGESARVAKTRGDPVYAGTVNGNGAIDVVSTKPSTDTALAQVIRMVGEARKERSEAERWVERFARVYTPAVFAVAIAVALGPPILFGADWDAWLYRGLVLLVIGCPCALVIATPVAVVAGMAAAARHGVLIKGGMFLEIPASLRVVALDKTGTLTEGRPGVVSAEPLDEHTPAKLLAVAAAIELRSQHPIARAIVDRAHADELELPDAQDVEIVPGRGTTGSVRGTRYWLGSHRWLEERGQETEELHGSIVARSDAGHSVVVVGTDEHVCGFITLADAVRPDAASAVADLRAAGITTISILTGDNAATARSVADAVGISDVRAELLPVDKVAAVEALEKAFGPVAMVGDGVNDAPALARATLGVAMGAMGTDAAIESADIALMGDDLGRLAWLIRLSARTLKIIRQNTAFALSIKALFVILTAVGEASLWGAIAADMGASLLVVFNALRLLRER